MKSSFGWTLLSREDLKRAETQLREDIEGVRDEIGFLALHQAYADRFFPGTSVLHTRLRYVLFVPWLYQKLAERSERQIGAALLREETALAGRLKRFDNDGVIGGRSFPEPTSQPPSMVYWTALGTWRILRPMPDGGCPSRASVHRALSRRSAGLKLRDEDRQLIEESEPLFTTIPSPPSAWRDTGQPLGFTLLEQEQRFLRSCLVGVLRPGGDGQPSLLARLAVTRLRADHELWDPNIAAMADAADQKALHRAERAAALAAIGRAVYAALVETIREQEDGLPTETTHRQLLRDVLDRYRGAALQLDIEAIPSDAPHGISEHVLKVLRETQAWIGRRRAPIEDLYQTYECAELRRKGRRARLVKTLLGRERRAEWTPEEHAEATALHYRWSQVRRLLLDLQGRS